MRPVPDSNGVINVISDYSLVVKVLLKDPFALSEFSILLLLLKP